MDSSKTRRVVFQVVVMSRYYVPKRRMAKDVLGSVAVGGEEGRGYRESTIRPRDEPSVVRIL